MEKTELEKMFHVHFGYVYDERQKKIKPSEIVTWFEKFASSGREQTPAAGEGEPRWVRASERIPDNDNLVHCLIDGETKRMGHFFEKEGVMYCFVNGPVHWEIHESLFHNLKWLDTAETPSDYKEITGFDTIAEHAAYNKGREHEQMATLNFIEKWDGSTNSALGELLLKKLKRTKAGNECSWGSQEGILLTIKEAEYFLSLQASNESLKMENEKLRANGLQQSTISNQKLRIEGLLKENAELNREVEKLKEESKHDLDVITHYEDLVKEYEKDLTQTQSKVADLEKQLQEAKEIAKKNFDVAYNNEIKIAEWEEAADMCFGVMMQVCYNPPKEGHEGYTWSVPCGQKDFLEARQKAERMYYKAKPKSFHR